MTVHQPSGDETVYNLTLNNGAWNTNTQRFSGAATNGKLVSTMDSDYDFSIPCGSSCTGSQFITAQKVTTTLADVSLKLTDEYSYADPHLGLVGSKKRYDFYTGSLPSAPTTETKYTYGSKIPGDITQVETVDGTGNTLSRDKLTYLTTPGPPSGVVDGHDATKSQNSWYQSIAHWINTSETYEITYFSRDDAGSIYEQSLPYNSAVGGLGTSPKRTFGHDPSTDTFVTSKTEPIPSSGVAMSSAASFEPTSGVATSATDYNGQTSSLGSYDYLGRVGEVDSPDGGITTYSYSPTQKIITTKIDQSRGSSLVEATDEFGRPSRSIVTNGAGSNSWYQQDTCYNSNGQVQAVSMPYAGTGLNMPMNCSGTQYTYDALGRPKTVTNADGTTQYNYTGRATQTIDVNGRQKITQVDGLGRLTAVCEVSSQNVVGGSPQNCGLDIAGAGYLTTYTYELANHRTTVTQGIQNRETQTDSLGRVIFTSEPERGRTNYTYAYQSNGEMVMTRTRPLANQSDPNKMANTITTYDIFGRVVSVQYKDGAGATVQPSRQFVYDRSDRSWPSATLAKGRLTSAGVGAGSSLEAISKYNYDAMGRIAGMFQFAPGWCTQPARTMNRKYGYDQAGNQTFEEWNYHSNGATVAMTFGYTVAGELDWMRGGLNDGDDGVGMVNRPYFYQAAKHTPFGTSNFQFGNGLYGTRFFDGMGRIQGQWECIGTYDWACGDKTRHVEGYLKFVTGNQVTQLNNVQGINNFAYDDLGRVKSMSLENGPAMLSWDYDRYGNRYTQNDLNNTGYPRPTYTFDINRNQITSGGFKYDVAGNMIWDGSRSYIYDQEGNIVHADNGVGGLDYVYDALNRRVLSQTNGQTLRYEYNASGQISDIWKNEEQAEHFARYYVDGQVFAYWDSTNTVHFLHGECQNTMHAGTDRNGKRESTFYGLPYGDAYSYSGAEDDGEHYAMLDRDAETDTHHAQYRQYSSTAGLWMSPDPYNGSYDPSDPQSFNRYSYLSNNPMLGADPSGLLSLPPSSGGGGGGGGDGILGSIFNVLNSLFGFGGRSSFKGSTNGREVDITPTMDANGVLQLSAFVKATAPQAVAQASSYNFLSFVPVLSGIAPSNAPAQNPWNKFGNALKSCAAGSAPSAAAGAGAVAAGTNALSTAGKFAGMTAGTSIASQFFRAVLPQSIGATWAPTLMNPMATSGV